MTALPTARQSRSGSLWRQLGLYLALAGYALLIGYGSLYPFASWRVPDADALLFLLQPPPSYITRTDTATNILAYLPFGLLLASALNYRVHPLRAVLLATVTGLSLSIVMEVLQMFVPGRISSNLDILTNGVGAFSGALAARLLEKHRWPSRMMAELRRKWLVPGLLSDAGVLLLGLWALSQFSLQLPSLVGGRLYTGFTPFWEVAWDGFQPLQALVYAFELAGLGLFAATLLRRVPRPALFLCALFGAVLLLKTLAAALLLKLSVLVKVFSLEATLGLVLGFALMLPLLRGRHRLHVSATLTLGAYIAVKMAYRLLQPEPAVAAWSGSMLNITGLAYLVSELWPFLAIGHVLLRRLVARAVPP